MAEKRDTEMGNVVTNCDSITQPSEIEKMIFCFRGQQVMIDHDLATLYGVGTKVLNQAVKRNIDRFPDRFRFQLSKEEKTELVTNCDRFKMQKHSSVAPYAFTEQGISMLSAVLRSQTAVEVSIRIMDAFVAMRRFLSNNAQIFQRLANIEYHQIETDKRINEIFKKLNANTQPQQGIFFDGQVFDAYRFASDLIRKANTSIVLIDNYVDDTVLSILDKRADNVSATIYTQHISPQFLLDIERHNAQYPVITIKHFNKAHDRFLLIDDEVYHIGASIKDLGKKWFGFTLMHDITTTELINKIQGM